VIKFSKTGAFIMQIGKAGTMGTADSTTALNRPAAVAVDDAANEVYVADTGDHRIRRVRREHGRLQTRVGRIRRKRRWTPRWPLTIRAHRRRASSATHLREDRQGRHGLRLRQGQRPHPVFDKTGKSRRKCWSRKTTTGEGSVSDIAFSADAQQRFLYVAASRTNGVGARSRVARDGVAGGRGAATRVCSTGSTASRSIRKGNLYTAKTYEGKRCRVQLQGLGVAPPMNSDEGCSRKRGTV